VIAATLTAEQDAATAGVAGAKTSAGVCCVSSMTNGADNNPAANPPAMPMASFQRAGNVVIA
jgi:hypothetical protein